MRQFFIMALVICLLIASVALAGNFTPPATNPPPAISQDIEALKGITAGLFTCNVLEDPEHNAVGFMLCDSTGEPIGVLIFSTVLEEPLSYYIYTEAGLLELVWGVPFEPIEKALRERVVEIDCSVSLLTGAGRLTRPPFHYSDLELKWPVIYGLTTKEPN